MVSLVLPKAHVSTLSDPLSIVSCTGLPLRVFALQPASGMTALQFLGIELSPPSDGQSDHKHGEKEVF